MSLLFDTKEDLHLRMVDLQQKLKESEEERRKLEKTCDALIKAFREDERMHYKVLNNQYENFLEDCRIRKKRNDIILKSLYKVEDRAKSLFNKTEKLKLLKDRYTAYLRQNDFLRKEEIQNVADPKLKASIKGDTTSKSVHWKTPNLEDVIDHNIEELHHLNENCTMKAFLEISEKNINKKIFPDSSVNNEKNNDLYTFLVKNKNKEVLENYTNSKGIGFIQEDSLTISPCRNSDIQNRERENISEQIKSEQEFSKSNASKKNSELVQPVAIKDEKHTFEKSLEKTSLYTEDKIKDNPTISNNTSSNNFLPKNSTFKNTPCTFEKTVKDSSEILELKIPFQDLNTENDHDDKLEIKDFETKILTINNVKDQPFNDLTKNTGDCNLEKNNIKDSTWDLKGNKSPLKEIKNGRGEVNHAKTFDHDCNPGSFIDFSKENISFAHEMEKEKNPDMFQNDACSEFSSNNKIYPKGLDGIDYENETYPDSYYEQPEHTHNLSSIASNVILEEDEYDLEADQEKILSFNDAQLVLANNVIENYKQPADNDVEKSFNPSVSSLNLSNHREGYINKNGALQNFETKCSDTEKNGKFLENPTENFQILNDHFDEILRTEDTDSEKSFMQQKTTFDLPTDEYQSSNGETKVIEDKEVNKVEGNKSLSRSNLIHLLESDSESFQIEHGEAISGNEDSDFDFSLKL